MTLTEQREQTKIDAAIIISYAQIQAQVPDLDLTE